MHYFVAGEVNLYQQPSNSVGYIDPYRLDKVDVIVSNNGIMNEDDSRIRRVNAVEIISSIKKMVLNILRKDKGHKGSVKRKRFKALLDEGYMEEILSSSSTYGVD